MFAVLTFLLVGAYFLISNAYSNWGRTLFYARDDQSVFYPGTGKFTQLNDEIVLMIPKAGNVSGQEPRYINPEDEVKYSEEDYEFVFFPKQLEVKYAVGRFDGWEDIEGSVDKYIIIEYPDIDPLETGSEKFRVGFAESTFFGESGLTRIGVQDVGIKFNNQEMVNFEKPEKLKLDDLTYGKTRQLIKPGDVIAIRSLFDPPVWSKQDQAGNYLASWIILRRVGGKDTLNKEIERL